MDSRKLFESLWRRQALPAACLVLCAACGGGGGGGGTPAPPAAWTGIKQLGVSGQEEALGLSAATDAAGSVYVAGFTDGGLGGNTLPAGSCLFAAKYTGAGVLQ